MKIIVEFDLEIDGELDEEKAKGVFAETFAPCTYVCLSEVYEGDAGNKDWALYMTGWRIV